MVAGAVAGMTLLTGCRNAEPFTLFNNKPLKQQQHEAQYFDPFPLPECGPTPPGMRPRSVDIPAPEPYRAVADPAQLLDDTTPPPTMVLTPPSLR